MITLRLPQPIFTTKMSFAKKRNEQNMIHFVIFVFKQMKTNINDSMNGTYVCIQIIYDSY